MKLKVFFLLVVLVSGSASYGQKKLNKDTTTVDALITESKGLAASDSAKAFGLAMQAKQMARELKYPKGEAMALKYMGMVYYMKGMYAETLGYWIPSLEIFEKLGDDIGISNMLNNIGAIYLNQGADDKALEYMLKSLQLAEKTGDTLRIATALSNVGGIYHNKRDPIAINYLVKAIPYLEGSSHNLEYIGLTANIGEVYFDNNNTQKAFEYFRKSLKAAGNTFDATFGYSGIGKTYMKDGNYEMALLNLNKALSIAEKEDDKLQIFRVLRALADVYQKQDETSLAIEYNSRAENISKEMDDIKVELSDLYKAMSTAYEKQKDFSNAYLYKTLYSDNKDSLWKIDTKKKLNQLQFDFELTKKEGEIVLQEAKIKSEKAARMGVQIGLGLILIIAFIIYRNYLQKVKVNKILDKQKDQIEQLLLNILPKEVASELQTSGKSIPRHFEEVSVLFTDFKGFTSIADKLSPQDVVEELNECFMAFDNIMEKYDLEKIKTIGDSYMCAGNMPSPDPDHAYKIIKAAMEIQRFVEQHNLSRELKGLEAWEIRIGVHTGPVVAGVVGKKKYAYDIWGSTVNIASRMESNGTPGRVNISAYTYEIIKHRFQCSHRGKIYAKNLGELDMYYIDHEKSVADPNVAVIDEKEMYLNMQ
ncbi:MAG TPA: adenylate/guanylate cyclase domain-containing protein [Flavitalea sp.]|nr:adenylate/guanylate cyclase domain-containing protein [Flavitalea sp.]